MNVGKDSYIVKTLAGDYVSVRNSIQFAKADAERWKAATGNDYVIFRVTVQEVIAA